MALGISSGDIAYSASGIDNLKTVINNSAKRIKNDINPDSKAFSDLVTTLRNNWSGDDCDRYIADLKKAANTLTKSCDDLANKLNNALENYKTEFQKMQRTTYEGVNVKRSV